ncbi:MAG: PIG-L family deacetylase [Planctomycetes bacterium]|nr:PIG-L family deacetylase [Planctomycetota bacterium]
MNYRRILVFGAHPDDEITMARTMARLADEGVAVTVVIMTNGCEGYPDPKMKKSIVRIRAREARNCNRVLGIARRVIMDIPDMGLTNDKPTLKRFIKIIRDVRPDAIFTHGPHDEHRDHVATHFITRSAYFHAGEPVAAEDGKPWKTPYLYYYKGVRAPLPQVVIDVSAYKEKGEEAWATQVSQYAVFRKTAADFKREIAALKKDRSPAYERFWVAEPVILKDFPPLGIDAPDNYYGKR